jgi:hypothetical protein
MKYRPFTVTTGDIYRSLCALNVKQKDNFTLNTYLNNKKLLLRQMFVECRTSNN